MSSRIFQSVVLQMKDSTDRAIGVIDSEGTVVACNDLTCIGERWPGCVDIINSSDRDTVPVEGKTFKALAGFRKGRGRACPSDLHSGFCGPQRRQDLL